MLIIDTLLQVTTILFILVKGFGCRIQHPEVIGAVTIVLGAWRYISMGDSAFLSFIVSLCFMLFIYRVGCGLHKKDLIKSFTIITVLVSTLNGIADVFISLVTISLGYSIGGGVENSCVKAITILLTVLMYWIVLKGEHIEIHIVSIKETVAVSLLFLADFTLLIAISSLVSAGFEKEKYIYIFMIFDLLIYGQIIETINLIRNNNKLKGLNIENNRLIEIQAEQYEYIKNINERTARFRHDIKNHVGLVSGMLNRHEYGMVIAFISELAAEAEDIVGGISVNNHIADAILNHYKHKLSIDGNLLEVKGYFDKELNISMLDLSTLLHNIMQNAVEAISAYKGEKVQLIIANEHEMVVIEERNRAYREISIRNNNIETTKEDSNNHGLGIGIVREVAEKAGGFADCGIKICEEVPFFYIRVAIPNN